jgi:hypothetical protein
MREVDCLRLLGCFCFLVGGRRADATSAVKALVFIVDDVQVLGWR